LISVGNKPATNAYPREITYPRGITKLGNLSGREGNIDSRTSKKSAPHTIVFLAPELLPRAWKFLQSTKSMANGPPRNEAKITWFGE
jgi:hypothetical protein